MSECQAKIVIDEQDGASYGECHQTTGANQMTEYIAVECVATISAKVTQTIHIPKEIWGDCDDQHLWGERADKYIRENIDGSGDIYWDEHDVEVDDATNITIDQTPQQREG